MKALNLFIATLLLSGSSVVFAADIDELWEITNTMEMEGMSMPASTQRACIARNQPYKPEPEDKNCKISDVRASGNRTTWKMKCTGKDAMEGTGDITKTATTMKGVMAMTSQGERMAMKMNGRIVGKCNAAAEKKKMDAMVADAQAKGDAALAQGRELQRKSCEDIRKSISTKYSDYDYYAKYQKQTGIPPGGGQCKVDMEASRKQLCNKATVNERDFAKEYCPDIYAAMKVQHCTGRSSSFRDLCDGVASGSAMDGGSAQAMDNPASAIMEGAKGLLKGFGF